MVMNCGACLVTGQVAQAGKCVAIHNCKQVGELLLADLPAVDRVIDQPLGAAAGQLPGQAARCTLVQVDRGTAVAFHGLAAGPEPALAAGPLAINRRPDRPGWARP